jgi:hypothetical protein
VSGTLKADLLELADEDKRPLSQCLHSFWTSTSPRRKRQGKESDTGETENQETV